MKYEEILELTRKGFNSEQICRLAEMEREEKKQQGVKPDTPIENKTKEGEGLKVTPEGSTAPRAEPEHKTEAGPNSENEELKKLREENERLRADLAQKAVLESAQEPKVRTADDILMEIMKGE